MSKILIETYRGFDIEFDTNCEKFQCICTEENAKESTSFTAVKKFVDDYKKTNQDFKPFWVEPTPERYKSGKLKVIGVRKDGRFVAENSKGDKIQISDYDLNDYMLLKSENEMAMNKLSELKTKEEQQRVENNETRKLIISEINIITLKDYKKQLQQHSFLKKEFWKEHTFWSDGYFVCSIGEANPDTIRKYIENQG